MQSKCEWLLDVLWMRIQIVRKWIDKIGTRPPQQMRHFAAVTECFREVSMDTNLGAPAAVLLSWIVSGGLWWHQPPV